ncbi:hypothetical protein NYE22_10750 [Bacillus sp. FSL K6-1560]|uniref:hypothetical protein n=1 Tax=Bacillus sp. FSL K6-1560 TaxID=2975293 RepID=UPI003158F10A
MSNKNLFYLVSGNLVLYIIFLYFHFTISSVKTAREFLDNTQIDPTFYVAPLITFILSLAYTGLTVFLSFKQGAVSLRYGEWRESIFPFSISIAGVIGLITLVQMFLGKFSGVVSGFILILAFIYALTSSTGNYSRR